MKKDDDFELDMKSVKVHAPSLDFASRVTLESMKKLKVEEKSFPWMYWIPRICVVGFILVLLTLSYFVIQNFNPEWFSENFILGIKVIGFLGFALLAYSTIDRLMKRLFLGVN